MASQGNFKIDKDKFLRTLTAYLVKRVAQIGAKLEAYCKQLLSTGNANGLNPSKPGDPPHTQTGLLRASIGFNVAETKDGVILTFGVRKGATRSSGRGLGSGTTRRVDNYALALELGTSRMAARPYLRPTILSNRDKIIKWLTSNE